MLAGVLVVVGAYGLAELNGRLRADVVRDGTCASSTVTSRAKEHFTVQLGDGTLVKLYGSGDAFDVGEPLSICERRGTWADRQGDAGRWLLTSEPAVFPAAIGLVLVILGLYAGDGVQIGEERRRRGLTAA